MGNIQSIISIPEMKERTILLDGFSKTYAMTGWRLGFGIMKKELALHIARIETNVDSYQEKNQIRKVDLDKSVVETCLSAGQ